MLYKFWIHTEQLQTHKTYAEIGKKYRGQSYYIRRFFTVCNGQYKHRIRYVLYVGIQLIRILKNVFNNMLAY